MFFKEILTLDSKLLKYELFSKNKFLPGKLIQLFHWLFFQETSPLTTFQCNISALIFTFQALVSPFFKFYMS